MNKRALNTLEYARILEMLSQCTISALGEKRALELMPEKDIKSVRRLLDETKEAESMIIKMPAFPLMSFNDINSEAARLTSGASLNCKELLSIALLLRAAKRAKKSIVKDEEGAYKLLPEIANGLYYSNDIISRIENAIIGDEEISDSASSELSSIRQKIKAENLNIREKLQNLIRNKETSKYLQDAIITMRDGRFVVPVKVEYKGQIRGVVHGESASGATLFIEPMAVVEANNALKVLEEKEQKEIERILMFLSDMVRPYVNELRGNLDILSYLDLVFAKASLALKQKAMPPEFNETGLIDINKGRHPLIDENLVIPVSIKMDSEYSTLIITGPNTGGKTVTLKLIGLFCAMAQSGMFLPCAQGATIPVFKDIFADIGDEQSIEQSLSTFSSHMKNIIYIVRKADEHSLILLDELGAGTDPEEGASLAMAILDELSKRGSKLIATTHYSEIKAYAMTAKGFLNASMEFDTQSLSPTFKLIMGVAGASNAFLVSKRLGLSSYIIDKAKEFMSEERLQFDKLLFEAKKVRSKADREMSKAKNMQKQAEEIDKRAKAMEQELSEKRKAAIEKAKKDALEIVNKAKEETEQIIKEVKKIDKMTQSERTKVVDRARKNLTAKKDTLASSIKNLKKQRNPVNVKNLKIGDSVNIISIDAEGTVATLPDSKGFLEVQAGIMKLKAHVSDLDYASQPVGMAPGRMSKVVLQRRSVPLSLNLHGYTVDEATLEIDKYLDDAFLSGLNEVSIVHGKGTGTLRRAVKDYLKTHPHVAKMRMGELGEGDTGVTIVTLK